ncbi:hypothetical protein QJS10_CPB19g00925 [Acorus calamus]|uniref:DUF4283 domain-containing protein n=1 Tax=Acorus calamus TaxID=4465 RepID=A0AAV9CFW9_ACOCL|nr:hypothetical protein QJS10_CPB19g00925 [Acorus calamus]
MKSKGDIESSLEPTAPVPSTPHTKPYASQDPAQIILEQQQNPSPPSTNPLPPFSNPLPPPSNPQNPANPTSVQQQNPSHPLTYVQNPLTNSQPPTKSTADNITKPTGATPSSFSHLPALAPTMESYPTLPPKGGPVRKQRRQVAVPPPSSSIQVKSWGSLFHRDSPQPKTGFLKFIEPTIEGVHTVASLNPEAYAKNIKQWDHAVVGYIIGKLPVFIPFLQFLRKLWKPKGDFQLLLHGNGFFTVKFDLEEDSRTVLEGGPWTMDYRPFILRKWSPDVRMEQERLSSIPLWIRLPNLPLHLWEEDCLSRIGSTIGVPLYADLATLRCSRASYARICVEVQATMTLPDSVLVDIAPGCRESFKIDYDWKPMACKFCQTFGHDEACCILKPAIETTNSTKQSKGSNVANQPKGKEKMMGIWQEVRKAPQKIMSDAMKAIASSSIQGTTSATPQSNKPVLLQVQESTEVIAQPSLDMGIASLPTNVLRVINPSTNQGSNHPILQSNKFILLQDQALADELPLPTLDAEENSAQEEQLLQDQALADDHSMPTLVGEENSAQEDQLQQAEHLPQEEQVLEDGRGPLDQQQISPPFSQEVPITCNL